MGPKLRKILVCCAALVVVAGVSTALASGMPEWRVEAKVLKSGEKKTLREELKVKESFTMERSGGFAITCSKLHSEEGSIEGPNKGAATALVFTGCVPNSGNCEIEKEEFKTNPVSVTLEESGENIKLKFVPVENSKHEKLFGIVTIKDKGVKSCAQAGKLEISGSVTAETETKKEAETEQLEHVVRFTTTSGSVLKFGGEEAKLTGNGTLALNPSVLWSAT